jgi:hypothetical protein
MSAPENLIVHGLHADDFILGQQGPPKRKRQRTRRLDRTIAEVEKGGKTVQAVTLPDGTKLDFGKAEQQGNELDQWIAKHAHKTERH